MASIRETLEAVFAAQAFAERGCTQEAYECLGLVRKDVRAETKSQDRKDTRPRARV